MGRPVWNVTPFRSLKVHVLPSLDDENEVASTNRLFARLVAGLLEDGLTATGSRMEDPIDLAADLGDRRADRVRDVGVLRSQYLADTGEPVGHDHTTAAHGDQRPVAAHEL